MSELTQAHFDKQYGELVEFLSKQFDKLATKTDLQAAVMPLATKEELKRGFAEQTIKLEFIQTDVAALRKDLLALSKRTKEDASVFVKDLLKLKSRLETLEKQFRKFKAQVA